MATNYVSKINGNKIFAERAEYTREGVNIDSKLSELEQEITSMGAFDVVPLTSGENPVPDVPEGKRSTKIIYLTQEAGSSKRDPYTEWIWIPATTKEPVVAAHWQIIGETSIDLSGYKTKQTAVSVTGGTLKGVASFVQNANGDVTLTLNDIQDGTTSQKGVVQLEDSHESTSTTTAATPKNVKEAYDLANGKQDPITFDGTYDASTNKAATVSTVKDAVANAVAGLDAEETSTDGKNVQVKVTQDNGVITGVSITTDNTLAAADIKGKADKVSDAVSGNLASLTAEGNLADSGKKATDFKTVQTAVVDPTAHTTVKSIEFIDTISQNVQGVISPTKKAIREATTSQTGIVQLAGSIGATVASENNKAATEKAVRDAINALDVEAVTVGASKTLTSISEADGKISTSAVDIQIAESQVTNLTTDLASKQDNLSFEGTYDASTNKVATESTVSDAIEALDVSAISVGADKTLSSISETDGKISATPVSIQIAETQVTNLTTDLGAKADKVTSATSGNFAGLDKTGNLTDSGSKAADFATSGHVHGNISNDGKINSTADLAVVTGTSGVVTTADLTTADPTVPSTGTTTAISFIDSVSQNSKGKITATKKTVQGASGSQDGLMSSGDYTKLSGIEDGAQVNVIEAIQSNGTALSITNKTVNIPAAAQSTYGVVTVETTELSDLPSSSNSTPSEDQNP